MSIDLQGAIDTIERSLGLIPGALLAIVFLAGPTLAWLLYRFVVQPRTRRYAEQGVEYLWLCPACKSANEFRIGRCYRCGLEQGAIVGDLHVIDSDGVLAVAPAEAFADKPHPVGATAAVGAAGLAAVGAVAASSVAGQPIAGGLAPGEAAITPRAPTRPAPTRPLVPVGPGKPVTPADTGPDARAGRNGKRGSKGTAAGPGRAVGPGRPIVPSTPVVPGRPVGRRTAAKASSVGGGPEAPATPAAAAADPPKRRRTGGTTTATRRVSTLSPDRQATADAPSEEA